MPQMRCASTFWVQDSMRPWLICYSRRLTPFAIDTAKPVYEELHTQAEAAQCLRDQQVERARYAAELAQRRFLRVDPENRLVASVLEAEWNARLQEYSQVQQEVQEQREKEQRRLSAASA
jgi:hypothetical protein